MSHRISLLVVDDDASDRKVLQREFERRGHMVAVAGSAEEANALVAKSPPDVIVLDLKMAGTGGIAFLKELRSRGHDSEVVILTGFPSLETAVAALRQGAFDCRSKPVDLETLETVVQRAAERRRLRAENTALKRALAPSGARALVSRSGAMQKLLQKLPRIAASNSTVLIQGETGTGKERVAREIHRLSPRANEPLVVVDCGALQSSVRGSELFGCEKGAFAGADQARPGLFEAANGGTVFLDEVGELDMESQASLLRALESDEVRRVGSVRSRPVDLRVVAASHCRLADEVEERRFREDLFFRLQVVTLDLPPLRSRREDILPLFAQFMSGTTATAPALTDRAQAVLLEYAWPGNVRELENLAEMLAVTVEIGTIDVTDLPPRLFSTRVPPTAVSGVPPLADVERRHILAVYEHAGRNKRRASELLGISLRTLYNKLTEYNVHGASREPASAEPQAGESKP